MKLLIINGFPFHYEMIGHAIDYCQKYLIDFDVHTNEMFENGWISFYQEFSKKKGIKPINFLRNVDKKSLSLEYDKIFVLTDNDMFLSEEDITNWGNKLVTIDHYYKHRTKICNYVDIGPFIEKENNNYLIPVYGIISAQEKNIVLKPLMKTRIVAIGSNNPKNKSTMETFNFQGDYEVMCINRGHDVLIDDEHYKYFYNLNTVNMIELLKSAHYIFIYDYLPDHGQCKSFSASIGLGLSTLTKFIIPSSINKRLKFKGCVEYDRSRKVDIPRYSNVDRTSMNNLQVEIKRRDEVLTRLFK